MSVALAIFEVFCVLCFILGALGSLQALPAVAVMTSAIMRSAAPLLEFSLMVVVIMPFTAVFLYNASLTDERLTVPTHLTSFMGTLELQGARTTIKSASILP